MHSDGSLVEPGEFLDAVDELSVIPGASLGQSPVEAIISQDAARYQDMPAYKDRVYGRAFVYPGLAVVLQYWVFYYNNPKTFFGLGSHEGDWELVQFELDLDGEPMAAAYAQHGGAERCPWGFVEKREGRPVVYVANGSHASYFMPGSYPVVFAGEERPGVSDSANGEGYFSAMEVEQVITEPPAWLSWNGQWGGSDASPKSPPHQGASWEDPLIWASGGTSCDGSAFRRAQAAAMPAPPGPSTVTARRVGATIRVEYEFDPQAVLVARAKPWRNCLPCGGARRLGSRMRARDMGRARGRIDPV